MEKKKWDLKCPSCKKKFLKEEIDDRGFVDHTTCGDVINCPYCGYQWLEEK